jgi:predicted PurR-regulated permease PerM
MPLLVLCALLVFAACLWILRAALAPFFAAVVFAYLLWPMFCFLSKRVGKVPSAIIVVFSGMVVGAAVVWGVIVAFDGQIRRIIASFPEWKAALEAKFLPWFLDNPWILQKLRSVTDSFDPMVFVRGISGAGLGVLGWMLQALSFALVPLIAYYMLMDGPKWLESSETLVPERFRSAALDMLNEINERLGGFIRGELMVVTSMSFLQGLAFAILGVPYAWLLGLVAGVSNIVPYSPYVTALPMALLLTAFEGAGWGRIIAIGLTFFVVQKAEGFYFTPVWVGRASRLHPLEVLLALVCFGFAFGLLGLIFAVPLMIVIKVAGKKLLDVYRANPWFGQSDAETNLSQ